MKPISFFIPIRPVPASRVRVTAYGNYYAKNYETFRVECHKFLKTISRKYPPQEGIFSVDLEFICYRPKNPTNIYPHSDIDNLAKAPLDSITKAGMVWQDDMQITELTCSKRYQNKGEPFGIKVIIRQLT